MPSIEHWHVRSATVVLQILCPGRGRFAKSPIDEQMSGVRILCTFHDVECIEAA